MSLTSSLMTTVPHSAPHTRWAASCYYKLHLGSEARWMGLVDSASLCLSPPAGGAGSLSNEQNRPCLSLGSGEQQESSSLTPVSCRVPHCTSGEPLPPAGDSLDRNRKAQHTHVPFRSCPHSTLSTAPSAQTSLTEASPSTWHCGTARRRPRFLRWRRPSGTPAVPHTVVPH